MKERKNKIWLNKNHLKRESLNLISALNKSKRKRLIEIGGAAESVLGRPFQEGDLQKFINFLKQQEIRGNYYSKAMNSSTDK